MTMQEAELANRVQIMNEADYISLAFMPLEKVSNNSRFSYG